MNLQLPKKEELQEFFDFVKNNEAANATKLRLKNHVSSYSWMQVALNHIEAKNKAKVKLGGYFLQSYLPLYRPSSHPQKKLQDFMV